MLWRINKFATIVSGEREDFQEPKSIDSFTFFQEPKSIANFKFLPSG